MFYVKSSIGTSSSNSTEIEFNNKLCKKKVVTKQTVEVKNTEIKGLYKTVATKGLFGVYNKININDNQTGEIIANKDFIQITVSISGDYSIKNDSNFKPTNGNLNLSFKPSVNSNYEILKTEEPNAYTLLLISRKLYLEILKNKIWAKNDSFYKNVVDKNYVQIEEFQIDITFEIIETLKKIFQENSYGEKKHFYLRAKLEELFLLIHIENSKTEIKHNFKKVEISKLKEAKLYIEKNLNNPPSIKELSKIVFLNELKLKTGFKQLYEITIHNYIIKNRMVQAVNLMNQNLTVNEIASTLGYKSASHFIKAFKTYYGRTPNKYKILLQTTN